MNKGLLTAFLILPNIALQSLLQGSLGSYALGTIAGCTLAIWLLYLLFSALSRRLMKSAPRSASSVVGLLLAYGIYYGVYAATQLWVISA